MILLNSLTDRIDCIIYLYYIIFFTVLFYLTEPFSVNKLQRAVAYISQVAIDSAYITRKMFLPSSVHPQRQLRFASVADMTQVFDDFSIYVISDNSALCWRHAGHSYFIPPFSYFLFIFHMVHVVYYMKMTLLWLHNGKTELQ